MSRRMLTMSTVHFQARIPEELHARLVVQLGAAGVPWHLACDVIKRMTLHTCRAAAAAQLRAMVDWTPDQWREQEEVRIATQRIAEDGVPE